MKVSVAMLCSVFPPSVGGIQTHTLRVSQKLAARGVDVLVVTRKLPGTPRTEELGGVRVLRMNAPRPRAVATGSYVLGALRALSAERHGFEVLHAQQMLSPMTIGLLGQTLFRKPLVVNPHASGSIGDVGVLKRQGPVGRGRLRAAVRRADAFIGISGPIRSELTEIGVPASRIWAIPNGVDTDHFRPAEPGERARLRAELGLPPGRIVVYAGRLSRQKGVDILLDAWARLPGLPAHLIVLGDGEETAALRAQAASLDRVHFLGATGDVAPYLRAADAFALGSRVEGLSVAVLEAMASGLSIAATAVGGTPEVLEDGITGRLVPGEDPQAMAHAIHETTCSEEAVRWAQRAREVAVRKYSIDQVAVRYEELYTRLMAGHNGNGAPGKRR